MVILELDALERHSVRTGALGDPGSDDLDDPGSDDLDVPEPDSQDVVVLNTDLRLATEVIQAVQPVGNVAAAEIL